ncbi:MAG: DUF5688 family protein [Lachnospiraceae bacterium]|jgi:hypothetical protein
MNYEEFKSVLVAEMEKLLKPGERLEQNRVPKLNGELFDAVTVVDAEHEVFPTQYLNIWYEVYKEGNPVDKIAGALMELASMDYPEQRMGYGFISDFENVSDKICCRLVNTRYNSKLLQRIPSISFLDLSVVFYIMIESKKGCSILTVDNNLLQEWDKKTSDLIHLATENTKRLNGKCVRTISEIMETEAGFGKLGCPRDFPEVYVVGSKTGCNGAIYMLDLKMMEEYASRFEDDVLIIPSSVHEILVAPLGSMKRESVDSMIRDVNETVLSKEEHLSGHAYVYFRSEGKICA